MAERAEATAMAAANAADPADNPQVRYAARTAALAAETLAQALCAFAPEAPPEADDILELNDPVETFVDSAATFAHLAAYAARFVLKEARIEKTGVDDYATLLEQCVGLDDPIGSPVDLAGLGSLWRGDPPDWQS